jgi:hypothetical protein
VSDIAEFLPFPKMARLNRDVIVSEKIDGTNGCIAVDETGTVLKVGSRNRWLRDGEDNYGFYKWAMENREELLKLGPGRHFGEYWGRGIQRNYGLTERRFSLFNVARWVTSQPDPTCPGVFQVEKDAELGEILVPGPECCHVVPVLWRGNFHSQHIENTLENLRANGSYAAPGFMRPEGIVLFHTAAGSCFKVTLEGDDKRKSDLTSV